MQCPECGLELRGDEAVCPRCLTRLVEPEPQVEEAGLDRQSHHPLSESADLLDDLSLSGGWSEAEEGAPEEKGFQLGAPMVLALVLLAVSAGLLAVLVFSVSRNNANTFLEQAQEYYGNGQVELALASYLLALDRDPDLVAAEVGAGWCYLGMERYGMAVGHFDRAVQLDADHFDAHLGLGLAYKEVHMWLESEASLKKALNIRQGNESATRALGQVYLAEDRYAEAIEVLSPLLQAEPDDVKALEVLGRALYHLGRPEEAKAPLQKAVDLDPDNPQVREALALTLQALGRCDWALDHFRFLQSAYPGEPDWHAHVGQCLYELAEYGQAVANLNQALSLARLDPVVNRSLTYLGWSYYREGRYDESIVLFERALLMAPQEASAMAGLGWCYAVQVECDEAQPLFERALEIDPYLKSAQEGLAACAQAATD